MSGNTDDVVAYIEGLQLPRFAVSELARDDDEPIVDIADLPKVIVAGSNMIEFDESAPAEVREAVAGALLLAQVAAQQQNPTDFDGWYRAYTGVLKKIGFQEEQYSRAEEKFQDVNASVHNAIIPLLTAAFGPAVAAGSLIILTLRQLETMKGEKWITLFEQRSQRLNASDFQFAAVKSENGEAVVKLAGATLSGSIDNNQVLFFKLDASKAKLVIMTGHLTASPAILKRANPAIQKRLEAFVDDFIREVDIGAPPA